MNWPSNWRRRKRSAEETHEEEEEEDGDDRCDGVRSFSCRVDSGQNSTKWTRGWNNEPFRASKRTHRSMILVWLEELYMSAYVYIYFCFCLKWFEFKLNLIRGLQNSAKHINYFTLQPQSQVPTKVSISLSSFSMIFLLKSNSVSYPQRSTMFIFVSLFWNLYCLQNLKSIW